MRASVVAHEVAIVDQVVVGWRPFGGEIDVAAVAIAQRPLILVLVTAEAAGHLREDGARSGLRDLDVAPHAVALRGQHVLGVLEAQVLAREPDAAADVALAVAAAARVLVVRAGVAPAALGVGRKVERRRIALARDARVTLDAVDPLQDVRAVLERMPLRRGLEAEDARAGGQDDRQEHQQREARPHRISSARESRTSASVS